MIKHSLREFIIKFFVSLLLFFIFLFLFNTKVNAWGPCRWNDWGVTRCWTTDMGCDYTQTDGCSWCETTIVKQCCDCYSFDCWNRTGSASCSWRSSCDRCSRYGSWANTRCGGGSCSSSQMQQVRYKYYSCKWVSCAGPYYRCVSSSSCRTCGSWTSWRSGSCGQGSCSSSQRYQYRYRYWSDGSGVCDTDTRCVSDGSCSPPTPTLDTRPDCGHTCLNHGAASVAWPHCSCTNRSPASGYERIGTWGSRDCSQCTAYRPIPCTCGSWVNQSCGGGSCSALQRLQTRTCNPSGCSSTSRCVSDSSCCSCSGWVSGACGPDAGCAVGQRRQTRTCNPSGCSSTSQCVNDASCNPSCSISLSPTSLTLGTRRSDLITAEVIVENATVDRVEFTSSDEGVVSVDPSSDSDSPYRTQVTGVDVGEAEVNAQAVLDPSGSCNVGTPTSITVEFSGWFQTQGGTIHAEGNLSDNIPGTAAIDKNMSIAQDGFPGVISHQSLTEANFGEGYPSNDDASHWLAESSYQGKNFGSWTFFEKKYAVEMETEDFDGNLPGSDGIYYSGSDKTLQGSWNVSGGSWILVLVDGNITIPVDISVPEGSFLGIVSSGNISFTDAVSQVEGMFIANNSINTGSTNTQFQGEGLFAASQFVLLRDLEDINPTTPGEIFTFRPDFLINSYKDSDHNLWWFDFRWEEIAP